MKYRIYDGQGNHLETQEASGYRGAAMLYFKREPLAVRVYVSKGKENAWCRFLRAHVCPSALDFEIEFLRSGECEELVAAVRHVMRYQKRRRERWARLAALLAVLDERDTECVDRLLDGLRV